MQTDEIYRRLSLAGVRVHRPTENRNTSVQWWPTKTYDVLIDQQRIHSMICKEQLVVEDDPIYKRLAAIAIRAVYALAYDYALVTFQVQSMNEISVLAVEPKPPFIMVGADPEFVLLNAHGKIVPASRYFGGLYDGIGTDAARSGGRVANVVAELRPAPSAHPAEVVSNIRHLLQQCQDIVTDDALRWVAGAMPVQGMALGGHVHLSGVPLTSTLLRQLDSYVAFLVALCERTDGLALTRRQGRHGRLGSFRPQAHGGFEYRTLPSWLVSPQLAGAVIALALLCARHTSELTFLPSQDIHYVQAYYDGDHSQLRQCVPLLREQLSQTSTYRTVAEMIEPLFQLIDNGKTWNDQHDFRSAWQMV